MLEFIFNIIIKIFLSDFFSGKVMPTLPESWIKWNAVRVFFLKIFLDLETFVYFFYIRLFLILLFLAVCPVGWEKVDLTVKPPWTWTELVVDDRIHSRYGFIFNDLIHWPKIVPGPVWVGDEYHHHHHKCENVPVCLKKVWSSGFYRIKASIIIRKSYFFVDFICRWLTSERTCCVKCFTTC